MDESKTVPDLLIPLCFQKTFHSIRHFILKLFNAYFMLHYYPYYWKTAEIKAHRKPGKDDLGHYKSYFLKSLLPIIVLPT